jgi:hypothetical protein
VWGGPPDGNYGGTIVAGKLAFAPRGKIALPNLIGRDLWEIGLKKAVPAPKAAPAPTPGTKAMGFGTGALSALVLLALGYAIRRRRRA